MELPPESKYKTAHESNRGAYCTFDQNQYKRTKGKSHMKNAISSDSLLFSETRDEETCDVDACFEMQCHQVFIGMVTMQYQAQTDVVHLVERLDHACIRFVHFSKENELRSRVFSEKLGLESGWNCHISLLSDEQSSLASPKSLSRTFDPPCSSTEINAEDDDSEFNKLLPATR